MDVGTAVASDASCQVPQLPADFGTLSKLNFLKKFLPVRDYPSDE